MDENPHLRIHPEARQPARRGANQSDRGIPQQISLKKNKMEITVRELSEYGLGNMFIVDCANHCATDASPGMNKFVSQFNLLMQIYLVSFKLWMSKLDALWEYIVSRCSVNLGPIGQILLKVSPKDEFPYHVIYPQQRLVKQPQNGYKACRGEIFNGLFLPFI